MNLIKRAKALIPLLVPLFVSSLKRAEELAVAMECRCYRLDRERTKMDKTVFGVRDALCLIVFALLLTAVILLRILPYRAGVPSDPVFTYAFYRNYGAL